MADTWNKIGKASKMKLSVKKARKKKGLTKKISDAEKELFKLIK